MASHLLIVSKHPEDLKFGEFLAFANDLALVQTQEPEQVRRHLLEFSESVVLWGADQPESALEVGKILEKCSSPARVFAVTDLPFNHYPELLKQPVFGHHLIRRFESPAPELYARLVGAAVQENPLGLAQFFPEGATRSKITLTRSGQKRAATEGIQNFFMKQQVNTRLAVLVAQAVDELLMNAIFDAPVLPNGKPLRRGTNRNADFELIAKEHVVLEVASGDDYVGVCVADQFGSLKKNQLMGYLGKDYDKEAYVAPQGDPGAGLGLYGIIQTGLSLVFISQPGVRTEVMIFFSKGSAYRDFRSGFRFFSVLAP